MSRADWIGTALLVLALLGILGLKIAGAQTTSVTTEAPVPAGTWFAVVRAFNTGGLFSGYSNEVRVTCTPAVGATTCPVRFWWDANSETDLAGYVLTWGPASGVYTQSQTVPATPGPGRLPAPTLRIRP